MPDSCFQRLLFLGLTIHEIKFSFSCAEQPFAQVLPVVECEEIDNIFACNKLFRYHRKLMKFSQTIKTCSIDSQIRIANTHHVMCITASRSHRHLVTAVLAIGMVVVFVGS